jgi:predicted kinase
MNRIIIRGPLGIGKSTIAEQVAKKLGGMHISVDRILDEHHLTSDHEEGYISQKSFLKANKIAVAQARAALDKNLPVIFDGNFYWKSQVEDLLHQIGSPCVVFTLKAPLETCIKRDAGRTKPCGEGAAKAVYAKATSFDYGISIDTANKSAAQTADVILSHIRR